MTPAPMQSEESIERTSPSARVANAWHLCGDRDGRPGHEGQRRENGFSSSLADHSGQASCMQTSQRWVPGRTGPAAIVAASDRDLWPSHRTELLEEIFTQDCHIEAELWSEQLWQMHPRTSCGGFQAWLTRCSHRRVHCDWDRWHCRSRRTPTPGTNEAAGIHVHVWKGGLFAISRRYKLCRPRPTPARRLQFWDHHGGVHLHQAGTNSWPQESAQKACCQHTTVRKWKDAIARPDSLL